MKRHSTLSRFAWICSLAVGIATSIAAPAFAGYYEDFSDRNIVANTNMTVASWGTNRLDVFARLTVDNKLWHNTWSGTTWAGWENGAGSPTSLLYGPAAFARGTNIIDLFATGTDNGVYWNEYTTAGWAGWTPLGPCVASSPAVSAYRPSGGTASRMDLWVTGCDHVIWHRAWLQASGWTAFENGAGAPAVGIPAGASPTANTTSDGSIRLFVRGNDNALYFRLWSGTAWGPWTSLSGALASDPAVTSYVQNGHDRVDVYAKGTNGYLWHTAYEWATGWRNWDSLYRTVSGSPAVVAWNPSGTARIDLLASQTAGYTHATFTGMYDDAYPPSFAFSNIYKVANAPIAENAEGENYLAFFPPQQAGTFARAILSMGQDPNPIHYGDPAISVPLASKGLPNPTNIVPSSADNYVIRTGPNKLLVVRQSTADTSTKGQRAVHQFYESTDGGNTFSAWANRVDGQTVTVGGSQKWYWGSTPSATDSGVDYPTLYLDPFSGNRFFSTQLWGAPTSDGAGKHQDSLLFRANSPGDLTNPIAVGPPTGEKGDVHFSNMTSVPSGRLFTSLGTKASIGIGAFGAAEVFLTWFERADLVPHVNGDAPSHSKRLQDLPNFPLCTRTACTPGEAAADCSNSIPPMSFNRTGVGPQHSYIGGPQISRVGSYPVGDVIRIAYPFVAAPNGKNVAAEFVAMLLIGYEATPTFTVLATKQFLPTDTTSGKGFIGQFTFIETDRLDLGSTFMGNTALAYWREGSLNTVTGKLMEKIRCAAVRDIDSWSAAQDITTTAWDQAADRWWGDLLQGGFFYDSTTGGNGSLTFVPMWTQPNAAQNANDVQLAYVRYPW